MKKINLFFVFLIALTFIGCSSDSSSSSSSSGQTVSFKFNGQNLVATVKSATIFKSPATNEEELSIIAETNDKIFEFNFFSTYSAGNGIASRDYISGSGPDDGYVYVSYKIGDDTYGMHNPDSGVLTISSVNASAKKVSGTFNQVMTAIGETADFDLFGVTIPYQINITNGVFTNINYNVVVLN